MSSSSLTSDHSSNEEKEICPICLEPLPLETWRGTERSRMLCCGYLACASCSALLTRHQKSLAGSLKSLTLTSLVDTNTNNNNNSNATITRDQMNRISTEYAQLIQSMKCPMCRTDLPKTSNDKFHLLQKNVQEHPDWGWAQYKLGKYYETGVGCPINYKLAFACYERGANLGDSKAQQELGNCYCEGRGVPKSEDKAIGWYKKAANEGRSAAAQWSLGQLLCRRGNHKEAFRLFQLGAEEGLPNAQCSLAYCYENGEGIQPPSLEKSMFWNKKAAHGGNETAMANYAGNLMQFTGMKNGGRIDLVGKSVIPEVLYWARKSVSSGNYDAQSLVDQIERGIATCCGNCQKRVTSSSSSSANNNNQLSRCSKCKAIYYCCRSCQAEHWKKGHKWDCMDQNGVKKIRKNA